MTANGYHELTELEGTHCFIKNYCIAVKEQDDIVFLRSSVAALTRAMVSRQQSWQVPDSLFPEQKEIASELTKMILAAKAKEIASVSAIMWYSSQGSSKADEVDMQQTPSFDTVKDDDITVIGRTELSKYMTID